MERYPGSICIFTPDRQQNAKGVNTRSVSDVTGIEHGNRTRPTVRASEVKLSAPSPMNDISNFSVHAPDPVFPTLNQARNIQTVPKYSHTQHIPSRAIPIQRLAPGVVPTERRFEQQTNVHAKNVEPFPTTFPSRDEMPVLNPRSFFLSYAT